jgi:hypothetical protein
MIIGMSLHAFTVLHTLISLIGIVSGLIWLAAMLAGRDSAWTSLFLLTTVLTSVTGFMFHSTSFGPPQIVGVISLVALAIAIVARYLGHLAGHWRWMYVVYAVMALYLNVFVGVAQSFDKIPALHALAPTATETPFKVAQLIVLVLFVWLGFRAVKRFRPVPSPAAATATA